MFMNFYEILEGSCYFRRKICLDYYL